MRLNSTNSAVFIQMGTGDLPKPTSMRTMMTKKHKGKACWLGRVRGVMTNMQKEIKVPQSGPMLHNISSPSSLTSPLVVRRIPPSHLTIPILWHRSQCRITIGGHIVEMIESH